MIALRAEPLRESILPTLSKPPLRTNNEPTQETVYCPSCYRTSVPDVAQEIDAAAFIHEYSDRAILEASCTRKGSQSTALVRLTEQFGGYVNYVSVVVTAPGQMRSPLIEREIPVDQPARAGHIFLGRPSSATFIGAFWGLSATGNPIRYSIPDGTTVTCD